MNVIAILATTFVGTFLQAQLPIERLWQISVTCLQKLKFCKMKNALYKILRVYLSDSCSGCP